MFDVHVVTIYMIFISEQGYTVSKISWCGTGWNQSARLCSHAPSPIRWLHHTEEEKERCSYFKWKSISTRTRCMNVKFTPHSLHVSPNKPHPSHLSLFRLPVGKQWQDSGNRAAPYLWKVCNSSYNHKRERDDRIHTNKYYSEHWESTSSNLNMTMPMSG